jgi:cold shock CspA family protein
MFMGEPLLLGRVTQFRKEQGFGVITLDDGRDVKFDVSTCTMVPEEGDPVRLRIGPARWGGGFKALHVEPAGSAAPVREAALTLDQQIAILQGEHLVSGLSEQVMADLVAEQFGNRLAGATLIGILDGYYADDERAIADGYLRHDHRFGQETDDVLAELAARVPGARLPRQLRWDAGRTSLEAGHRETVATLHVELPDGGEYALDVRSLDDIVRFVNGILAAAGDARRFHALETDGDRHAYLALSAERAQRLAKVLRLQVQATR